MIRWTASNYVHFVGLILFLLNFEGNAQPIFLGSPISSEVYLEGYYGIDFGNPASGNRPSFLYSFHRNNAPSINFSLVQLHYQQKKVRGAFGVHFGTFTDRNYAIEPGILQHIYQAKIGFQLGSSGRTWIDMGIMESHIGFESAKGGTCWVASRSLLAENTPYYSAGFQLNYTSSDSTFYLAGLVLNGWQRITRQGANVLPAIGHQITWTPQSFLTFNSSSYIGNEYPEKLRRMRYFHHFYAKLEGKTSGLIAGFDVGIEQLNLKSKYYGQWLSAIVISRKELSTHFAAALRVEYFYDKYGIIIPTDEAPFNNLGWSLNVDYSLDFPVILRLEYRSFYNQVDYFEWGTNSTYINHYIGFQAALHLK